MILYFVLFSHSPKIIMNDWITINRNDKVAHRQILSKAVNGPGLTSLKPGFETETGALFIYSLSLVLSVGPLTALWAFMGCDVGYACGPPNWAIFDNPWSHLPLTFSTENNNWKIELRGEDCHEKDFARAKTYCRPISTIVIEKSDIRSFHSPFLSFFKFLMKISVWSKWNINLVFSSISI